MEKIKFFKYQGAGNDFIIIEDFSEKYSSMGSCLIEQLCDRNFGIGADGLVLIEPSIIAHVKMRFFNRDGEEADFCGNATRCVVWHLNRDNISIETKQGIVLGKKEQELVSIKMPFCEEVLSPIALEGDRIGHLYNTGVPHLILYVKDLKTSSFNEEARVLRNSDMFQPEGVNVSFIQEIDKKMKIRTYERGVEGETLACGTACAAVALWMRGNDKKKKSQYTVYPKSQNPLQFTFDIQENMWMKGDAQNVYEGMISIPKLSKVARVKL
ncbi:MAG: Diaminopimelate epimerase [Chlamydiia bacterium]|nr:Diaminopimelate epimerase [Chlamydiia bacterium]